MSKSKDTVDLPTLAREWLKVGIDALSESRESELDDLRFYAASPDNQWQWPTDVANSRRSGDSARPCLTINKLPQHVRQVTNDQRMNRAAIKVIPSDDAADADMAEVFNGIIRHIEYISDADVAYDTANDNQVIYGEGYVRILTEYCDDDSFDQDIKIGRIRNSFSVYMDPMIQDPSGADAEWCIISEDITLKEYERLYPKAKSKSSIESAGTGDVSISQWFNDKTVRVAECFYVDHIAQTLNLYPGNQTAIEGTEDDNALKKAYGKPVRTRRVDKRRVKWFKTNGYEVLESGDWAGSYIPVVRVVGNEFEVEGKIHVSGIVRNAKDAQRMYNYWVSQEAEMLALAPKAPFIGYGGQFEGYENKWKTANTSNHAYLEVNPDVTDGQGAILPLPQRAQPPMASSGLLQAKAGASEDIKATTGQYNASLGMTSNERSGKAIMARQREGDVGTYHYGDNVARMKRFLGRQLINLIPKIYDTERVALIVGEDGEPSTAKIDPTQPEAVRRMTDEEGNIISKIFNPAVGKYDVTVVTGPGYATKRQEALESMGQLLQGNPDLWRVAGDLFVKNMDWPGAQDLADRFKRVLDPNVLADNDNPALTAANNQIQAMSAEIQNLQMMMQNAQRSLDERELGIKEFEANIKAYQAETQRISTTQQAMTPEQIQDIVRGTIAAAVETGDLVAGPDLRGEEQEEDEVPEEAYDYPEAAEDPMQFDEQLPPEEAPRFNEEQP